MQHGIVSQIANFSWKENCNFRLMEFISLGTDRNCHIIIWLCSTHIFLHFAQLFVIWWNAPSLFSSCFKSLKNCNLQKRIEQIITILFFSSLFSPRNQYQLEWWSSWLKLEKCNKIIFPLKRKKITFRWFFHFLVGI